MKAKQPLTPLSFASAILVQFYRADQIDVLHLALTNILEMIKANEVDLILDQKGKSPAQRKAFIQKIIDGVESPELKTALSHELSEGNLEFFRERNLGTILGNLQREAEALAVVRLKVAVDFKPADLREIANVLSKQLGRPTVIDISVERSLIGGAIVQYGTAIRDYTLRYRLEQVKEQWREAITTA